MSHRPEAASLAMSEGALEILFATVQDLTSTLSTDDVIQRLLNRVLLHLDSEIGSILLVGPDGELRITHARGLPAEVVETTRMKLGEGISGKVAETGIPLLVDDVENDPRFLRRSHERYFTHSALSVPLRNKGEVVGVINVNNKTSREPYSARDLQLMEAIAGHAAVALSNARCFEESVQRAQTDALTGLANHGHFWTTLDSEIARASRYGRVLSLAMMDVDHFKRFNDSHGHVAGDRTLREVAHVLRSHSRVHDTPARYGGEEFAIILPETDLEGAFVFAEKIRQAVEGESAVANELPPVTISIGVASLADGAETCAELVELADVQLYRAKSEGRNRVVAGPSRRV